MARIGNDIKQGFYATPLKNVGEKILKLLDFGDENDANYYHRILDPCCGESGILNLLQGDKENIEGYGVELDQTRFEISSKYENLNIVHSPYQQIVSSNNAFDLIYNNPPYSEELNTGNRYSDEKAFSQMEYDFLRRAINHLRLET